MKKILKIAGLSIGGIFLFLLVLGIILELVGYEPDLPEAETESPPVEKVTQPTEPEQPDPTPKADAEPTPPPQPTEQVTVKPVEETPKPPAKPKWVVWNKTPAEQGLKVGDWIRIEGWQTTYIGAVPLLFQGKVYSWEWNKDSKDYNIVDYGVISLTSLKSGRSTPLDRIQYVESEIEKPYENGLISSINNIVWDQKAMKMQVIGKVEDILPLSEGDYHPNQWKVYLERNAEIKLWRDE